MLGVGLAVGVGLGVGLGLVSLSKYTLLEPSTGFFSFHEKIQAHKTCYSLLLLSDWLSFRLLCNTLVSS